MRLFIFNESSSSFSVLASSMQNAVDVFFIFNPDLNVESIKIKQSPGGALLSKN